MTEQASEVPVNDSGNTGDDSVLPADVPDSGATRQVKIDGQMVDVPIEDLEKAYGLETTSRKRFEEAASLRKEVDTFIDNLKGGDLDLLQELIPQDQLYDYAENILRKKVEWDETPEETRARIMAEKERDQYKSELEEYSKKEQEQIVTKVNEEVSHEIDEEISEVIEHMQKEHGNIVNTPEFIQDVARMMLSQLDDGADRINTRQAADFALRGWKNRIGSYVKNISHSDLTKYLSKEQLNQLRKSELDTALSQFPEYNTGSSDRKASRRTRETVDVGSFFDQLEKRIG